MIFNWFRKKQISTQELTAYRNTIKIYDIFTFFNELDLLEIRLNILYPYVDYFIIVESTETFSGLPKKLIFRENQNRFVKFKNKIIYYVIDDTPSDEQDLRTRLLDPDISLLNRGIITTTLNSKDIPNGIVHWLKEFYQKESVKKALVNLGDNDICYISDLDEIWDPKTTIDYTKDTIYRLNHLSYTYFLNNRSSETWEGTLVAKYKIIKNSCLNDIRTKKSPVHKFIKHAGWHFTNQGGTELIRKKIEASYSQDDFNKEEIKSKIQERILNNKDYIGRNYKFWTDEKELPRYLLDHKNIYKSWFK